MDNKDKKTNLMLIINLIMVIIFTVIFCFIDTNLNKYQKIFWSIPIIVSIIMISETIILNFKIKNKFFLYIKNLMFFFKWILLSSMLIIALYLNFSIFTKIIAFIILLTVNWTAFKKYILNKNN